MIRNIVPLLMKSKYIERNQPKGYWDDPCRLKQAFSICIWLDFYKTTGRLVFCPVYTFNGIYETNILQDQTRRSLILYPTGPWRCCRGGSTRPPIWTIRRSAWRRCPFPSVGTAGDTPYLGGVKEVSCPDVGVYNLSLHQKLRGRSRSRPPATAAWCEGATGRMACLVHPYTPGAGYSTPERFSHFRSRLFLANCLGAAGSGTNRTGRTCSGPRRRDGSRRSPMRAAVSHQVSFFPLWPSKLNLLVPQPTPYYILFCSLFVWCTYHKSMVPNITQNPRGNWPLWAENFQNLIAQNPFLLTPKIMDMWVIDSLHMSLCCWGVLEVHMCLRLAG